MITCPILFEIPAAGFVALTYAQGVRVPHAQCVIVIYSGTVEPPSQTPTVLNSANGRGEINECFYCTFMHAIVTLM